MPLQLRRGNTAEVNSITPLVGELVYDNQLKRVVVGDGTTAGGVAVAGVTIAEAKDAAAAALLAGTHQNIEFTYNSTTKAISAKVDILVHDTIEADAIVTSKIFNNSSTVVLNVDTATLNGNVLGNITGVVTGTAGSTLIGDVTGNLNGNVTGNVTGNADTATVASTVALTATDTTNATHYITFVDTATGNETVRTDIGLNYNPFSGTLNSTTFSGNLAGNVTGNLTGNVNGDLRGAVFGEDSLMLLSGDNYFISNGHLRIESNVIRSLISDPLIGNVVKIGDVDDTSSNSLMLTVVDAQPALVSKAIAGATFGDVPKFAMNAYGNSFSSPVQLNPGDYIGALSFGGYEPSILDDIPSGIINFRADPDGIVNNTNINGKFEFVVDGGNGTLDLKFMTFNSQGRLSINHPDSYTTLATLDVNGFAKLAVLTSAPASPVNGMVAIADGTSWDPAGTGKSVMVVYLAGGWRVSATEP